MAHALWSTQDGIALNVIIDKTLKFIIACSQQGVAILQVVYIHLHQRILKNGLRFLSFSLNHENYPQNVVSLDRVPKFVRQLIQPLDHLLVTIDWCFWIQQIHPALCQDYEAAVLLDYFHCGNRFFSEVYPGYLQVS